MNKQEIIRRELYCQTVQEISGSDEYLVVGIDVAKNKHLAFMGTSNGISLRRKLIFENNIEGFSQLLKTVEEVKAKRGLLKTVYGMEPTGNYHKPLARHLVHCDCNVMLVTGQAVKNNRTILNGRWDKNDTKDAANVADLVSRGKCLYFDWPSEKFINIRGLLSLRRNLKREEHRLKMRIRNTLLAQYFPELDKYYSDCESESLAIIKWCPNPEKIAAMEFDKFFITVSRTRRGIAQNLRLHNIYQGAVNSVGCPMGKSVEFEARLLVERLHHIRQNVRETEDLIEEICIDYSEYRYLLTIPGFGPYISSRVLASIGDPFRFKNRKQVLKMAGFDLCANRSGKTSNSAVPVISKSGNSELRYAVYQAAKVASGKVEIFRTYFAGMIRGREREKGIITKMRVKLAAKMLVIAWTLMKKMEAFNPDNLNMD